MNLTPTFQVIPRSKFLLDMDLRWLEIRSEHWIQLSFTFPRYALQRVTIPRITVSELLLVALFCQPCARH